MLFCISPDRPSVEGRFMVEAFKADLRILSSSEIVRKYVLSAPCPGHIITDEKQYQLKQEICNHFEIQFTDTVIVGSGKLGFSIKPSKRYECFGDDSDIDIAVVSTELFQKVWEEAYLYKKGGADWPGQNSFFKYLSAGWIRPDKLPSSDDFAFSAKWWDFFNTMTSLETYGPYKIRAGLYHSLFFLEEYQKKCVEECIEEISI